MPDNPIVIKAAWFIPHQRWVWVAVIGTVIAAAANFGLAIDSLVWYVTTVILGLAGLAVTVVVAVRLTGPTRRFWLAMSGFVLFNIVGDAVFNAQTFLFGEPPGYSTADFFYLASYLAGFAAAVILVKNLHPNRNDETWIDSLIIALSGVAIVAVIVISNSVSASDVPVMEVAVAAAYPLADIIIFAAMIRVIASSRTVNTSIAVVTAAMVIYMMADLFYNAAITGMAISNTDHWQNFFYSVSYLLIAAAALAPGARTAASYLPVRGETTGTRRVGWLMVGISVVPAMTAILIWQDPTNPVIRVLAVIAVIVVGLVLWRVRRLLQTVEQQARQISDQARTDALTGLPNRRSLDYFMSRETGANGATMTAIAMLDLDHFKEYNDKHGHQAADVLLSDTARVWRRTLPASHFLARYGGEEFTAVFYGVQEEDVRVLLERARLATPDGQTVSIGYALVDASESAADALRRADTAMYHAKRSGRNKVVSASDMASAAVGV